MWTQFLSDSTDLDNVRRPVTLPIVLTGIVLLCVRLVFSAKRLLKVTKSHREIFEKSSIGMGRVRFDSAKWIDVNDAFCKMVGRTRKEMLATPWPEITHPEDISLDLIPFRQMAAGKIEKYSVEKRFIHKKGHHVWGRLTLSLVRDKKGIPDYEIAIIEDISEVKAAQARLKEIEDDLKQSEMRTRDLADSLALMIWSARPDGFIEWYSRHYYNYTGSLPGANWDDNAELIHPDDYKQLVEKWTDSLSTGTPSNIEFRIRNKNGEYRWHLSRGVPIRNEKGEILRWVGSNTDIHDQKLLQEAWQRKTVQLDAIIENMPDQVFIGDKRTFVRVNQQALDIMGFDSVEDMTGDLPQFSKRAQIRDAKTNELMKMSDSPFARAVRGEKVIRELTHVNLKTGEKRTFIAKSTPLKVDNEIIGALAVHIDITERKHLESELQEKTSLFTTVMDQLPAAVIVGEAPSGRLLFASKQMQEVWRFPLKKSENIEGYSEWIAFHPDGRRYKGEDWPLARAITNGEIVINEDTDILRGDGTRGILRLNAAPVRNQEGEIFAGVVICQDVTEEVMASRSLAQATEAAESASQAKTAFLANMSHEIRTPLGVIQGFADLLGERSLDSEGREMVKTISRNTRQLTQVIGEILDVSKIEAGKMEIEILRFALQDLIEDVKAILSFRAMEKGIEFRTLLVGDTPRFIASDPTRLKQILLNLGGNAIKFTNHGYVEMRIECLSNEPPDQCSGIRVCVEDTGIGITPSARMKLFTPFTQADASMTRRFGGTGLGLFISRRLAQVLGGDLQLSRSEPGKGSSFSLFVKNHIEVAHSDFSASSPSKGASLGPQLPHKKILLVEDSPDNQKLLTRILSKEGAQVDTADNGRIGYEMALAGAYDLVLMDIQMPELNGWDAVRILRNNEYSKPVVALTAHALKEEREKSISAGFDAYLTKPVDKERMLQTLKHLISKMG